MFHPPSAETNPRVEAVSTFSLTLNYVIPTGEILTSDFSTSLDRIGGRLNSNRPRVNSVTPRSGSISNGKSRRYNIDVTNPTNTNNSYTITLGINKISGGTTYKPGPSDAVTSALVYFETRSFTATWGSPSYTGGKLQANIQFSHSVTGIEYSDFEVVDGSGASQSWNRDVPRTTGGSPTDINSTDTIAANTNILIAATPPANTNGYFSLKVKANLIRFGGVNYDNGPDRFTTTSPVIEVNNIPPATLSWTNEDGGTTLTGTLNFAGLAGVSGIGTDDFRVLNNNTPAQIQNGWSISIPGISSTQLTVSVNAGGSIIITANPPANTNDRFKIRLREESLSSSGDLIPTADFDFSGVHLVDNRPQLIVVSFTAPTTKQRGTTSRFVLTLSHSIPKTDLDSTDFTAGASASIASATGTVLGSNSNIFNIIANNPANSSLSYSVTINADSISGASTYKAGPLSTDNKRTSESVSINTIPFTATWSGLSYCTTSGKLSANIRFSHDVTRASIANSDFQIINSDGVSQGSWTDQTIEAGTSTTITAGTNIRFSAQPPSNTNASFGFRLLADSLNFDGGTENGPVIDTDTPSPLAPIDNRVTAAPTISTPIPDQTVISRTNTKINLNDHFVGNPDPAYTMASTSWITLSTNILTISPTDDEIQEDAHEVTIQASNRQGSTTRTISDTFEITVVQASEDYKYNDSTILDGSGLIQAFSNIEDITVTATHIYWLNAAQGGNIVRSNLDLSSQSVFFNNTNSSLALNSVTNDGTYLYVLAVDNSINPSTRTIYKYSLATGNRITDWSISLDTSEFRNRFRNNSGIAWNSNNNQLYVFNFYPPRNEHEFLRYSRFDSDGNLIANTDYTSDGNNHTGSERWTYDPKSNYFYLTTNHGDVSSYTHRPITAYKVGLDNLIIRDTTVVFSYEPARIIRRGQTAIGHYGDSLRIVNYPTVINYQGGGTPSLLKLDRFIPVAPDIEIPDQRIVSGTTATLDLSSSSFHQATANPDASYELMDDDQRIRLTLGTDVSTLSTSDISSTYLTGLDPIPLISYTHKVDVSEIQVTFSTAIDSLAISNISTTALPTDAPIIRTIKVGASKIRINLRDGVGSLVASDIGNTGLPPSITLGVPEKVECCF